MSNFLGAVVLRSCFGLLLWININKIISRGVAFWNIYLKTQIFFVLKLNSHYNSSVTCPYFTQLKLDKSYKTNLSRVWARFLKYFLEFNINLKMKINNTILINVSSFQNISFSTITTHNMYLKFRPTLSASAAARSPPRETCRLILHNDNWVFSSTSTFIFIFHRCILNLTREAISPMGSWLTDQSERALLLICYTIFFFRTSSASHKFYYGPSLMLGNWNFMKEILWNFISAENWMRKVQENPKKYPWTGLKNSYILPHFRLNFSNSLKLSRFSSPPSRPCKVKR